MNKSDVVRHVAEETGLTRSAAEAAVNSMLSCVAGSLARGETVSLLGFGTFGTRSRPARTGRNPRTGESLEISASARLVVSLGIGATGSPVPQESLFRVHAAYEPDAA